MSNYHRYTEENIAWIRDNIKGTPYKDLAKKFNDEFGTNVSWGSIKTNCMNRGLRNGNNTKFKRGSEPHNYVGVGTVSVNQDGYYRFKKNESEWVDMHVFIYEFFKGKIPKDYQVVFIDGDRNNLSIDNLVALHIGSERQKFVMNKHRMKDCDHNVSLLNLLKLEKALEEVSR